MDSTLQETRKPPPPKTGWDRVTWHFLVDVLLLLALLPLVWISTILRVVFPPPTKAGGWSLWGWDYDAWSNMCFGSLCFFLLVALVHVMLQWNWVFNFVAARWSKRSGQKSTTPKAVRTLYGVGTLIALLTISAIVVAAAEFAVKSP